MATQVLLPKLGNSVESSIIVAWLKQPGDHVEEGETLCTVETDKAMMDVPSTAGGLMLQHLVDVGDDVLVQSPIALIAESTTEIIQESMAIQARGGQLSAPTRAGEKPISPRALKLARQNNLDVSQLVGTGPGGRVIERDVQSALTPTPTGTFRLSHPSTNAQEEREQMRMTPVAKAMVERGGYVAPERGSGPDGRVTKQDLVPVRPSPLRAERPSGRGDRGGMVTADYEVIALPHIRRVIAERMRASLQTTAQLTMHASADARALLNYRKWLKASDESLGLRGVTINDLVLFAAAKTLPQFPQINATFENDELRHYKRVHLGFAVDAPRGLLVPVIHDADRLTLKQLADESSRLAKAAQAGKVTPDALNGGTFTVTNLGSFGIESFTPILNTPQVAILGVGNINLKAIEVDGEVQRIQHIGLSLTIDHQIVDGAPGAKFVQALARNLAQIELLLAL